MLPITHQHKMLKLKWLRFGGVSISFADYSYIQYNTPAAQDGETDGRIWGLRHNLCQVTSAGKVRELASTLAPCRCTDTIDSAATRSLHFAPPEVLLLVLLCGYGWLSRLAACGVSHRLYALISNNLLALCMSAQNKHSQLKLKWNLRLHHYHTFQTWQSRSKYKLWPDFRYNNTQMYAPAKVGSHHRSPRLGGGVLTHR